MGKTGTAPKLCITDSLYISCATVGGGRNKIIHQLCYGRWGQKHVYTMYNQVMPKPVLYGIIKISNV